MGIVVLAAGCTNAASGLDTIDDLQLIVDAGGRAAPVMLGTAHDGAPCLTATSSLGGTYGGVPLEVSPNGVVDCNFMRVLIATVDGPLSSSIVEVHDSTRSVSATFPADVLTARDMTLAVSSAAAGDVVEIAWQPVSDLVSGVTPPAVTFRLPSGPPGCEGCPPGPSWQTTAQVTATGLSFTVPPPGDAVGAGTLEIGWPDASGTATSCDLADCRYNLLRIVSQPFTTQ